MDRIPPLDNWSDAERWVWAKISDNSIADLAKEHGSIDVETAADWTSDRVLSEAFLQTILLQEPFRSAIPRLGVRIAGAWFREPVDLSNAEIGAQLWLDHCRFEDRFGLDSADVERLLSLDGSRIAALDLMDVKAGGSVNLERANLGEVCLNGARLDQHLLMSGCRVQRAANLGGLQVAGNLVIDRRAVFDGGVILSGADIGGYLSLNSSEFGSAAEMGRLLVASDVFMREGTVFKNKLMLRGAKIGGELDLQDSNFGGPVHMESLDVAGKVVMNASATFDERISMRGARIRGQLEAQGAILKGGIDLANAEVSGDVYLRRMPEVSGSVDLRGSRIGGQLSMDESNFNGELDLDGVSVQKELLMQGCWIQGEVRLIFGRVGQLDFSGSAVSKLDLTGTTIDGELRLGSGPESEVHWHGEEHLCLRNVHAGALQDSWKEKEWAEERKITTWPRNLHLDGFTYDRLGGLRSGGPSADMIARDANWYVKWLALNAHYSPQPYEQLASVFRAAGDTKKANAILFAGRKRATVESCRRCEWGRCVGMGLLQLTIGFGLGARYFWVLGWIAGMTAIGALVLLCGQTNAELDPFDVGWFSLDQLLPIVDLDASQDEIAAEIESNRWFATYFHFHKLVGYLLGSFLIAGLAGLTQK